MLAVLASVLRLASWLQASSSPRMRSLQAFVCGREQVRRHLGLWSLGPRAASTWNCCSC